MKITNQIILDVVTKGIISEKEINLIKNRMNKGEKVDLAPLWDSEGIKLEKDQNGKGFNFLWSLYKSPSGKERINSPYGYREIEILEKFEDFTFKGYYDAGRYQNPFFVPLYECNGANTCFEYYYAGGKLNIIG